VLALGFFDRADVSTSQGSDPTKIVVTFDVNERSTGQFNVGAGFSSIETFIATATVNQQNLFGNGQALSLQASISGLRQLVSLRLYEPYFLDSDWSFSTELFNQYFIFQDFARLTRGGSITFGYAIIQPKLRLGMTLTAQHDSVDSATQGTFFGATSAVNLQPKLPLANLYTSGRTMSVRPTLTYDTRDNRIFPTSGMFLQASSEFATSLLGSQLEFIRHRLTTQFYLPLGGNTGQPGSGFVLKMRNDLGLVTSPNDTSLPIYARFFLGGIFDMRGYRLRTIGPRLPVNSALDPNSNPIANGAVIGGNMQAYTNIEFEFPVLDKVGIRGVAFFDVGNTWNLEERFCKTAPAPQFSKVVSPCFDGPESMLFLRTSAGFGVRWFSPLGPLRFEWGFPLMPLPYEEKSVFEFTIGNSF
jgi:outer membrane protein insertion porin family